MRCFFPSFQDCYNCASLLPRWDGDIYARHKARHSYRDRIGTGVGGSPETCMTDISPHIFISFPLPLLTFSHTHSSPFPSSPYPSAPPLLIICSSGPKKCSSANLTLKTFWKKSFHFLQPLSRLRSPFLHSKHNFRNIFTRISRQCDVKSSFVELLKCKFKSPFLFNIGI